MYAHILLPVDLNEESSWRKALPTAVEYCKAFGSTIHMTTVVPDFGTAAVAQYFPEDFAEKAIARAEEALRKLIAEHVPKGVTVAHSVAYGGIYKEILRVAKEVDADLIVMASHRPELKDYLLGPNAASVVRHSDRSVLVVRE